MSPVLRLDEVRSGYGKAVVLNGVSFELAAGESLALLGKNGVGKTTLLETLMGNTQLFSGSIHFKDKNITFIPSFERARLGFGWVPQERAAFPSLTVEDNLRVIQKAGAWNLKKVYELFPRLAERSKNFGDQLSGGEQQMLVIGRALMTNPTLLLLDEPMEGLAPVIVSELAIAIKKMAQDGLPCIVVEQQPILTLSITDKAIVLERGRVVMEERSQVLAQNPDLLSQYLGLRQTKEKTPNTIME